MFQLNAEPFSPIDPAHNPAPATLRAAQAAAERGLTAASVRDAELEIRRLLGAEATFKRPAVVLLRNLHNFSAARRPKFEHAVCDLVAKNRKLADEARLLHAEIQRYGLPVRGFVNMNIPPLALTIFQRSSSFEQVIERILDLRCELAELRSYVQGLHDQLSDPRTSLERSAELLRDWDKRWRRSWDEAVANQLLIANTSPALLFRAAGIVQSLGVQAWPEAAMRAISFLKDANQELKARALRPVHTPVRNYLRCSRYEMCAHVSRVFETDPAKVNHLMQLLSAPSSLWRRAFRESSP